MAKRDKTEPSAKADKTTAKALDTVMSLRSMYRKPHYLSTSAWTEHVPFAFWIVEALRPRCFVELGSHLGMSYFAFCQAVETQSLGTRCYAVDTWKGDEHAGHYGEEVYAAVQRHNTERYSSFSQLIRATFDDTLAYFADGSIDLLHIDGLHTLDAVRNDFESWLPKMSERGVILLHDTNVRERGFGVHLLLDELKSRFSVFEFMHCHGLGVVGVGDDLPEAVRALFDAGRSPSDWQIITEAFSRLGEGCFLARQSAAAERKAAVAEARAKERKDQIDALTKRIDALVNGTEERPIQKVDAELKDRAALVASLEDERDALLARLRDEEGRFAELNSALNQKRAEADETDAERQSLRAELEDLRALHRTAQDQLALRDAESATLQAEILNRDRNIETRFRELATLSQRLIEQEAELSRLSGSVEETETLRTRILALETSRREALRQIAELKAETIGRNDRLRSLESDLRRAEAKAGALQSSTSWKITAPLRAIVRAVSRK